MTLQDSLERQKAISPEQSYLVQAPAGSGKTELLTQRFLKLLARVQEPEQIIALTFTKKAANEMRERIIHALQRAESNATALTPHQAQTAAYALEAYQCSEKRNWKLLQQPGRLRIMTIDSLCHQLAHAIPLEDAPNPFPEIDTYAENHYRSAAEACLTYAINQRPYQEAIKNLLKHLDNQQETLLSLFISLLQQRVQWLRPLQSAKEQSKSQMEEALAFIEKHELARFKKCIPDTVLQELMHLARQVAEIEPNLLSPRKPLMHWDCAEQLDRQLTASLSTLLLTSQNTLRKAFDHHVGIKRGSCPDPIFEEIKSRSKDLLTQLDALPDFLPALLHVKSLPEPIYCNEQWEVLQSLFSLLPLLVAHLSLQFQEHSVVDFIEVSEQALTALGDEENPTDLSLYLDNKLHHILIDEFQDTSIQQFHFIQRLVQGWQQGDGKTLFIVGDPMQSIYRFRAAEVGLFLQTKAYGIGPVQLVPLQLRCNFRSTETIINWVNLQFSQIFPAKEDIESGAISFHPSIHTQSLQHDTFIHAEEYAGLEEEADAIVKIVQKELNQYADESIAILVRSRKQLASIVTRLHAEKIPFQGVDIDLLANLPHLRDLWSLTQALLMPANRLAWLAVLRSPWCGIGLNDLLVLAKYHPSKSIYEILQEQHNVLELSEEGHIRCHYLAHVFKRIFDKRHQKPITEWILEALNLLHLKHILTDEAQEDLEQYWILLEKFSQSGLLSNIGAFETQLQALYSNHARPSQLHIMTIHKSKGLEFDCVILPGLSKKAPVSERKLIRWLKLPSQEHHEDVFLLSPIKAAHHDHSLLYDYIGKLDAQKNAYELQRLLYVAVTRSKKRLYLTDNKNTIHASSFRHLIKHPFDSAENNLQEVTNRVSIPEEALKLPLLQNLPVNYYTTEPIAKTSHTTKATFDLSDTKARRIGIIVHEILQWICDHHITSMHQLPLSLIENRLNESGLLGPVYAKSLHTITDLCNRFFQCPIGLWIIKPHREEQNEHAFLRWIDNTTHTRIIDRTFVENDKRWIIDFKTGQENETSQKKYHLQLNEYAQILSQQFNEPIHCGLYYLANNHWDAWKFTEPQCVI